MNTTDRYAKIREALEMGPTPGPWALQMAEDCPGRRLDEMVKWVVTADSHHLWISTGPTWDEEHDAESLANAALIAACNPDTIRELLAERDEAASLIQSLTARIAELVAERDLLQDILDSRPAINAALPDSYIKWSQAIYSGDAARAALKEASDERA